MYDIDIKFNLPVPWKNKTFQTKKIGFLNFLVGPNGTGKTRFANVLKSLLPKCRFLSADRLFGLSSNEGGGYFGNNRLQAGFDRKEFSSLFDNARASGYGGDAFILLEKKLDLRIKVESVVSQLLNREIRLEWDSGRLVPQAYNIMQGAAYTLHTEECHGIKELIVILTHIYNDEHKTLIIDEPELNLHPQYQAFLVHEIRKIAGNPNEAGKKIVFLITHSPFILDIRNTKDLASVICFHSDYREPSCLFEKSESELDGFLSIVTRLNVHHKQFFFAQKPVFVEGIFDSQIIKGIQAARNCSIEGSGSCIIDVGGNDELNAYYKLTKAFNKEAYFIYDLDSLFTYKLRQTIDGEGNVSDYLSNIGAGTAFQKTCGELEQEITKQIKVINNMPSPSGSIIDLSDFLKKHQDDIKKCRVAFLVHLYKDKNSLLLHCESNAINFIESRLKQIIEALSQNNVFLLRGGALENALPSYSGCQYHISEDAKKEAVTQELSYLNSINGDTLRLDDRYGDLYSIICQLPVAEEVDYLKSIEFNLQGMVAEIQRGIVNSKIESQESISKYIANFEAYSRILTIKNFTLDSPDNYSFDIQIHNRWGIGEFITRVNQDTNPTRNLKLEKQP